MSRLAMLLESTGSKPTTYSAASRCRPLNESTIQLDFAHRLFVPENYESGYDYPLVVWLHSDASSELELDNVMAALSTRNYIGIAPRANAKCKGNSRLFRWGSTRTDFAAAEELVWDCVQAAADGLSVNPNKIFLAGFGAGGSMAQWIGLKYARQVAGVVSLSGCYPSASQSLSNWKQARDLPVLFAQRQGSTLCSEDELLRAVRISHQSALAYRFWQLRSEDDSLAEANELDSTMLDAANRFMMSIVTNTELSLSPETTSDSEYVEFGFN
jgi:phospholipase/carboxylesterase